MRKKFKTILICAMLMLTNGVNAQKGTNFDWNPVMDAIIQVESKGNPKAHNKNGDCCGILQITRVLVDECNQILKSKKSAKRYTYKDRYNVEKSKEMFIIFQEHHNKSHNIEKAIRMWNGGPNYSVSKTNSYLHKVLKHYKGGN